MSQIQTKWLPPQALRLEAVPQTGNFQADNGKLYLVTPAGASVNVQLPPPVANFHCVVKDMSGDLLNKTVTIVRNGTELIDGVGASIVLSSSYQSVTLWSDGVDWYRI